MEKKIQKLDKIFAIVVMTTLFFLLIEIIVGEGIYKIYGIDLGSDKKAANTIEINWEELYPFSTNGKSTSKTDIAIDNESQSYCTIMNRLESIGESYDSHILKYSDLAKWGHIFNACLSDPGVGGEYVRLNNGYWTEVSDSKELENSIIQKANVVEELNDFLETENIPFLYVQAPIKNCQYDTELPIGVEDYSNENISRLLEILSGKDIAYIDMRQAIHEDYEDHYALFYKTDHHWNIDAGFWANNVIEQVIEEQYGIKFNTNYNNSTLYSRIIYENAMFGSVGDSVTHFVENSEDFSILFPNFETNFRLVIPDKGINATGSFGKLFINYDSLNEKIDNGGGYAYETILYGNRPLVQITNYENENGPKVMMIRDSFAIAVCPYMAIGCSELDLIDTRSDNGNFTGSVRTYIEQMKPDIVVMLVSDLDGQIIK
jgi:hypothetical protein